MFVCFILQFLNSVNHLSKMSLSFAGGECFQFSMGNFLELLVDLYLGSSQVPRKRIIEETVFLWFNLTSQHYLIQE